jgi:hypothetical protein
MCHQCHPLQNSQGQPHQVRESRDWVPALYWAPRAYLSLCVAVAATFISAPLYAEDLTLASPPVATPTTPCMGGATPPEPLGDGWAAPVAPGAFFANVEALPPVDPYDPRRAWVVSARSRAAADAVGAPLVLIHPDEGGDCTSLIIAVAHEGGLCALNTWSYCFGGLGVSVEVERVKARADTAELRLKLIGTYRGWIDGDVEHPSKEEVMKATLSVSKAGVLVVKPPSP